MLSEPSSFGSVFPRCEEFIKQDAIVFIQGKLNSDIEDNLIKIVADSVYDPASVPENLTESVILSIDRDKLDDELLHQLKITIKSSPGKKPLFFDFGFNGSGNMKMHSVNTGITMTEATLKQLCSLLGPENVHVKLREYS